MRLTAATKLVWYYVNVGHPLTPVNMAWNMVMRNFNEQWKALKEQKENKNPDIPKITKALLVIKWTEAFMDYLSHAIGVRMIPLAYVIGPEADIQWPLRRLHLVSHICWNTDRSNRNWWHVPRTCMRYPKRTTWMSTKTGRGNKRNTIRGLYQAIPEGKTRQGGMFGNLWTVCWKGQMGGGNQVTGATPPHTCVEGTEQFSLEKFIVQHHNALS